MQRTREFLAERARYWRSASRYRLLSTLFRENGASDRLLAVASSLELQLARDEDLAAVAAGLATKCKVLLAEIDTLLMRMNAVRTATRALMSPSGYSVSDVREEARVCMEEADDACTDRDPELRRSFAAGAFSLAQLAEALERERSS